MPPRKKRYVSSALGWMALLWTAAVLLTPFWPRDLWWLAGLLEMISAELALGVIIVLTVIIWQSQNSWARFVSFVCCFLLLVVFLEWNFYPTRKSPHYVKLLSMNMGGDVDIYKWLNYVNAVDVDILVLQELYRDIKPALSSALMKKKFHSAEIGHQMVWSRYPVRFVDAKRTRDRQSNEIRAGLYIVSTSFGDLPIYNMHLETPREGLEAMLKHHVGGIIQMMQVVARQEEDSHWLTKWIQDQPGTILAGDFNLSVKHPIFYRYWRGWKNAFDKGGVGFGFTKYVRFLGFRIDHILLNKEWTVHATETSPDFGGDHRALMTEISLASPVARTTSAAPDVVEVSSMKPKLRSDLLDIMKEDSLRGQDVAKTTTIANQNIVRIFWEPFERVSSKMDPQSSLVMQRDSQNFVQGESSGRFIMPMLNDRGIASFKLPEWSLTRFPRLRFAYKVPKGVSLRLEVQTSFGDWLCVGHSLATSCPQNHEAPLIKLMDDNQWQDAILDLQVMVRQRLPGIQQLNGLRFVIPANRHLKDSFWLDDLSVEIDLD